MTDELLPRYDVLVIGGGPAGLNGALMLARSRRSVLVVDAGTPRNAPAAGVHGFLSRDGVPPGELIALGRDEIRSYGAHVVDGEVVAADRTDDGFTVGLADGRTVDARRLLVTTGLVDELADVPGLQDHWGRDVVHCPFCHGWEVRDTAIGILATGSMATHQALLFRQLSDDVVLFAHTATLTDGDREQLAAVGVTVVAGTVTAVETDAATGRLSGLRLADGTVVPRRTVVTASRMVARGGLLTALGLTPVPHPMGAAVGEYIPSEAMGRTAVPGVFVAGNVTDLMAQVGTAAAGGALAGAGIHADLIQTDTARAVERRRQDSAHGKSHDQMPHDRTAVAFDADFWNDRYRSSKRIWSGNPNPQLVAQIADLPAGSALDVGCGEGADAIWLAERGWRVTAADISTVALDRAAAHAQQTAPEVAARIDWVPVDFLSWTATDRYDLVSAQFMHLPPADRDRLFRQLTASVRAGGTLLIVAHHPSDLHTSMQRPHHEELFYTGAELLPLLDDGWDVEVNTEVHRTATDPDGNEIAISDTVFRARRR